MPALGPARDGPGAVPGLPTTFRPLWAPRICYPAGVLLLVGMAVGAVLLPDIFGWSDRLMMVAVGLGGAYLLHRLAAVRLVAEADALTVVNLVRRRRLAWAEVLGVSLRPGEPWLTLDLSDGDVLAAMGVQGSDGVYARRQARQLGQLVAQQTRTQSND